MKTWLVAGFSALSLLYSCSDDKNSAGLEIHPPNDNLELLNHSSEDLSAYTFESENKIIVFSEYGSILLGLCNDPVLGQFQNNFITKVGFSSLESNVYDSIAVDSLILYLDFNSSDGDTTEIQEINIYELELGKDILDLNDELLYSHTLNGYYNPNEIMTTFSFQPRTSWYNDSINRSPIKIDLSDQQDLIDRLITQEIMEEFINDDGKLDTTYYYPYQDLTVFNERILNGFYFEAVKNDKSGSVANISMDSTKMEMFFRVFGDTVPDDTISYVYNISSQPKANLFYRTFNESLVYNKIDSWGHPTVVEDTAFYLKNNNAFYSRIVINDIGTWTSDSGSINKASILLEFSETMSEKTLFKPIESIVAFREIGDEQNALTRYISSEGGIIPIYYNIDKKGYEIVITREVQEMIKDGERSMTLLVRSNENSFSSRRVILNSPIKEEKPMKFTVTYTKY